MVNKLIRLISNFLASRICFFVFCVIAFFPLFYALPKDILAWCQYISQTVVQLVALNVLAIISKSEGAKSAKMLKETHDAVMAELKEVRAIYDKFCK